MTLTDTTELAQALFEEFGDALFLLDPETDQLIEVNPVVLRLTGFSRAELLQFPATQLFRFEAAGGMQRLRGAFHKTMVFHGQDEFVLRTKYDAWIPVNLTVSRLHLSNRTLGLVIARDDRDRRQAFAQARRVEAELRAVLASSPAALWSAERPPLPDVTAGWQFRYISPLLAKIAGRPSDFFDHPFRWREVVHPMDREAYQAWFRQFLSGFDTETEHQYRVITTGGAVRWVRDRLQVVRDAASSPIRLDGWLVDVTEQQLAELALRQSEQRFRALVEKSRDGILLLDERGMIRYASPAARFILGYDTVGLIGKYGFNIVHTDDVEAARQRLKQALDNPGEDISLTLRLWAADGSLRVIESNLCNRLADPSVRAVVVNYRDVTERNRLEEQLRQSQKLEAVGRLAGGIAHDFNNLLTIILGNLELVRSGADGGETDELLAATERAARQAAELTKQMLGFARRQPLRTANVDLNALVHEAIGLLRRTIDPRIVIQFNPSAELGLVAADPVQLQQVLMNLCLNARDAMPDGGTLTVATANAAGPPSLASGETNREFVRLSVTDTGIGMTEEVRAKIFEPFFTTKDVGQGTGLGLAVVYGVARAHGGWVECTSAPGAGSRFDVYLPRGVTSDDANRNVGDLVRNPGRGRGERVLVADDEPLVRSLACHALERHGYQVVVASDGAEAVEVFRREAGSLALVVLDASMPQMSGQQAFEVIRGIDPAIPVLFASGHSTPDMAAVGPRTGYLHKPYTPTSLAAAVRSLLDTPTSA